MQLSKEAVAGGSALNDKTAVAGGSALNDKTAVADGSALNDAVGCDPVCQQIELPLEIGEQ